MKRLLLALAVLLVGCDSQRVPEAIRTDPMIVNQCLRADLFRQCMAALPAGPASTKYNDWDEVVDSCGQQAYYQAFRLKSQVPQSCRTE